MGFIIANNKNLKLGEFEIFIICSFVQYCLNIITLHISILLSFERRNYHSGMNAVVNLNSQWCQHCQQNNKMSSRITGFGQVIKL